MITICTDSDADSSKRDVLYNFFALQMDELRWKCYVCNKQIDRLA